ncbi:monosaccharide ABC transporter membrane protein (CUT2 family) [Amycolatopsis cihanbeyliensis]|uniref:Monosaccharide ABC transporter membrane protein (CUT2 family) n=2 Tax=Amycolatopsis cihanbeyliensis TaxID=1128664 RepID=A0A542CUN6_AMYCI|nr:monosaccharide ABC transporter membrane protein (CUT2 family) [Amycolatopsis cihanbeyliensis]
MTSTKETPPTVDEFPGIGKRSLRAKMLSSNTFWIFLVLLALLVVFSLLRPNVFPTFQNAQLLLIETSVLLVLAVGMTFVITTAGIDLSVGSVLIFSGMVAAKTMEWLSPNGDATNAGWGVISVGLVTGVLAGAAWGLINGALVALAKIPPLIVTLGTMGAALGAANLLNGGSDINTVPRELNQTLGYGTSLGVVPNIVLVAVIITVIGAWLLHTTRYGRYTYAIGSNREAARRSGIGVTRHLLTVYLLTGFLAGIAGFMSLAYYASTTIAAHTLDNLDAISAVVLGGTSLFGGVGSMIGTVIGVFIPAVLTKGFNIVGVQDFWQQIALGAVLIAAVWFDQQRRRARNSR